MAEVQQRDAFKDLGGMLKGIDDSEAQKVHPRMPPSSFPIPMPGRNRQASHYSYVERQRMKGPDYQTGHTAGNTN